MNDIPNTSGIYKITCTANGKIYIGSAINLRDRKRRHFGELRRNKHSNSKLQNAWNKYGEESFTFEVLELVLEINRTAREQYWFKRLDPFGRKGFNIARDATTPMHNPEVRKKIGDAHRGRKQSPEHLAKRIGQKRTPEQIERIRQGHLTSDAREKLSKSNLGRKHTPEARENMRQAHLGHKPTPETLEKLRARKHTPEHREKNRQALLAYNARKRQAEGILT